MPFQWWPGPRQFRGCGASKRPALAPGLSSSLWGALGGHVFCLALVQRLEDGPQQAGALSDCFPGSSISVPPQIDMCGWSTFVEGYLCWGNRIAQL